MKVYEVPELRAWPTPKIVQKFKLAKTKQKSNNGCTEAAIMTKLSAVDVSEILFYGYSLFSYKNLSWPQILTFFCVHLSLCSLIDTIQNLEWLVINSHPFSDCKASKLLIWTLSLACMRASTQSPWMCCAHSAHFCWRQQKLNFGVSV